MGLRKAASRAPGDLRDVVGAVRELAHLLAAGEACRQVALRSSHNACRFYCQPA